MCDSLKTRVAELEAECAIRKAAYEKLSHSLCREMAQNSRLKTLLAKNGITMENDQTTDKKQQQELELRLKINKVVMETFGALSQETALLDRAWTSMRQIPEMKRRTATHWQQLVNDWHALQSLQSNVANLMAHNSTRQQQWTDFMPELQDAESRKEGIKRTDQEIKAERVWLINLTGQQLTCDMLAEVEAMLGVLAVHSLADLPADVSKHETEAAQFALRWLFGGSDVRPSQYWLSNEERQQRPKHDGVVGLLQ